MLFALFVLADDYTTVVTAARAARTADQAPLQTYVLGLKEIDGNPAFTVDDLVRIVPSVQTFRRSNSLTADPTSQGLSLRGIGPSGVSRALLLLDGVPMNDGYGGWVYWRALPRLALSRIEVVPGGGSAQYGSSALGGVMQMFTRQGEGIDADAQVGTQTTLYGGARVAVPHLALEAEALKSDGFVTTAHPGPIDIPAYSAHYTVNARSEWRGFSATAGFFDETQNSGTPLSGSHVRVAQASLGADDEHWHARLYGRLSEFVQTRSRIDSDRTTEVQTARQDIGSNDAGGLLTYTHTLGHHTLLGGVDARHIGSGALHQILAGVFAQESWQPLPGLELLAAVRGDVWHNLGRARASTRGYPSPKLALRFEPVHGLVLRAAGYGAFRAPTLNELYRPFQVGTIITAANAALAPETLWGGEVGATVSLPFHVSMYVTGFAARMLSPVANVTLADGSRERENLSGARTFGLEAGVEWRMRPWLMSFADTLTQSRADGGKMLAQDPVHRFVASVGYDDPRIITVLLQGRYLGSQYEDDLNTLNIPAVFLIDASASKRLGGGVEVYAAIQNLTGTRYITGRAGIDTVGAPFVCRGGIRLRGL